MFDLCLAGKWEVEDMKDGKLPGDKGLVLKSRAKHHAISAQLLRPFIFDTKPLIVQYEVNFQQGIDCGGAYVKLLSQTPDLNLVRTCTPWYLRWKHQVQLQTSFVHAPKGVCF